MSEEEIQKVLDELNTVRPEVLNTEAKKLFETIMKIADDRDKYKDLYNKEKQLRKELLFEDESKLDKFKDKINNLLKKYENEHFIAKVDLKSILEDNI